MREAATGHMKWIQESQCGTSTGWEVLSWEKRKRQLLSRGMVLGLFWVTLEDKSRTSGWQFQGCKCQIPTKKNRNDSFSQMEWAILGGSESHVVVGIQVNTGWSFYRAIIEGFELEVSSNPESLWFCGSTRLGEKRMSTFPAYTEFLNFASLPLNW